MIWAKKAGFFISCVVIVFTTLAYGAVHQPVLAIFYLLVAILTLFWALDGLASGSVVVSRSPIQLPLALAAAYAFIQIVPFGIAAGAAGLSNMPRTISVDPFSTQIAAVHFLALLLYFGVLLTQLNSVSRLRRMTGVIIVFAFLYGFFAILQSVLSPQKIYGIYETKYAVPFGSFVNRHNFAAFMEMTIALPMALLFTGVVAKDKRLLYITATGLMGIALLLSGSRGGLVAFVAEIVLLVFLTTKLRGKGGFALKLGLAGVMLIAVIGGAIFVGGETSLSRIAETAGTSDVTTGRSRIWSQTVSVISENFPFGAGFGAFGVAYTPHDELSGLERVEQAHNDYLQVVADAGLIGLAIGGLFLVLFIRSVFAAARIKNGYRRSLAIGAAAGCFAILVHSAFDFVLHTTAISVMFLTLLAVLVSSNSDYDDDIGDEPRSRNSSRRSGSVSYMRTGNRAGGR